MITTFTDAYFFRCITVHAPRDAGGGGVVSEGVENGLSLIGIFGHRMVDWTQFWATQERPILIAGLQEFNHPLSGDQGARVVVHPPGSRPVPSAEGFNVPPGFSGSLGVHFRKTQNLGEPYGKCSREDFRSDPNETYRLLPCLRRCMFDAVARVR